MKILRQKWILCSILLTALMVPVSAAHSFEGSEFSLRGCSFDQPYCSEKFNMIESRPNLRAVAIKYNITENHQLRLDQNFTVNFTFWKANYTNFGDRIVYHNPELIGAYEGTDLGGYRIFNTSYELNRTNYDFFFRMNYTNLNYRDVTNSSDREFAKFSINFYRINEGEDPYPPTPAPAPVPMPVEQLNQNGQNLTFTIIRGDPFTYTGTITQPRIAGNANITQARFWIFGDHYAEVTTVLVNRVNGSFTFALDRNETLSLNSSTYRLFAEYPPERDFFRIHVSGDGFIDKGGCVCNVLFSLNKARTMSGFESSDRFEDWVNGIPLQTPMFKTTITVVDPPAVNATVIPDPTWNSKLQFTAPLTTALPENVSTVANMSYHPVTTPKSSPQIIPALLVLILCGFYWRNR
jgi:hypothetical protein